MGGPAGPFLLFPYQSETPFASPSLHRPIHPLPDAAGAGAGEGTALGATKADVIAGSAVNVGLLAPVGARLDLVRLFERGRHVAFAMLAAVAEGLDVLQVPRIAGPDLAAGDVADAVMVAEHAHAHVIGNLGVIGLADPFFGRSHPMTSGAFCQARKSPEIARQYGLLSVRSAREVTSHI